MAYARGKNYLIKDIKDHPGSRWTDGDPKAFCKEYGPTVIYDPRKRSKPFNELFKIIKGMEPTTPGGVEPAQAGFAQAQVNRLKLQNLLQPLDARSNRRRRCGRTSLVKILFLCIIYRGKFMLVYCIGGYNVRHVMERIHACVWRMKAFVTPFWREREPQHLEL